MKTWFQNLLSNYLYRYIMWLYLVRPGIEILRWGFVPPYSFMRWVTSPLFFLWRRLAPSGGKTQSEEM